MEVASITCYSLDLSPERNWKRNDPYKKMFRNKIKYAGFRNNHWPPVQSAYLKYDLIKNNCM